MSLQRAAVWSASVAATVVSGVAINNVVTSSRWFWWALGCALLFGAVAAKASQMLPPPAHKVVLAVSDSRGGPPWLGDVSPTELGVYPNRYTSGEPAGYISRDCDGELQKMLGGQGQVVVVHGERLAGCTRTLVEAARAAQPQRRVLVVGADPELDWEAVVGLACKWGSRGEGAVLWLDSLTPAALTGLVPWLAGRELPGDLLVLATTHTNPATDTRLPAQVRHFFGVAGLFEVGVLSSREKQKLRADPACAQLLPVLDTGGPQLMGRLLVSLDQVEAALHPADEQAADRVALLHLVTDWQRLDIPRRLTRKRMARLFEEYWRELNEVPEGLPAPVSDFKRALAAWAKEPPSADRPRLVIAVSVSGGVHHVSHPLLSLVADDPSGPCAWAVSECLWSWAEAELEPAERLALGLAAYDDHDLKHARQLLERLADGDLVTPQILVEVACWLTENQEFERARRWFARAVDSGHPDIAPTATLNLGILEEEQGNTDQARGWYTRAVDSGHPDIAPTAMRSLGNLEREQGNAPGARHWYTRTAHSDHHPTSGQAMVSLGILEEEQGNTDQARGWLTSAIEFDDSDVAPIAMLSLGNLELGQGNAPEARRWFAEAITSGHAHAKPMAIHSLGRLEELQGKIIEARRWYGEAIASGHPDVTPMAMRNLGRLEELQGNSLEAGRWYGEAIASGHADAAALAMADLGNLENGQGNTLEARRWYNGAFKSGNPEAAAAAMIGLGILENGQGNAPAARRWFNEVFKSGNPEAAAAAMIDLAKLEYGQGDPEEARRWYVRAVNSGYPDIVRQAEAAIRMQDRWEDERRRSQQDAARGY